MRSSYSRRCKELPEKILALGTEHTQLLINLSRLPGGTLSKTEVSTLFVDFVTTTQLCCRSTKADIDRVGVACSNNTLFTNIWRQVGFGHGLSLANCKILQLELFTVGYVNDTRRNVI